MEVTDAAACVVVSKNSDDNKAALNLLDRADISMATDEWWMVLP